MRIATYNFNQGGPEDYQAPFRVLKDLQPDILCAQELCNPDVYVQKTGKSWIEQGYINPIWHPVFSHRRWGSAIFLRTGTVKEVPIINPKLQGWLVGVEIPPEHPLSLFHAPILLFSLHIPSKKTNNYYIWQAQEVLEYIFQHHKSDKIILAGDFNIEISARHPSENGNLDLLEQEIREYIRQNLNLVNSWQLLHPNQSLPSTYIGRGNGTHIDAILINAEIQRYLKTCTIITREQYQWKNADHCAIVAEFSTEIKHFKQRPPNSNI